MAITIELTARIEERLLARNPLFEGFFAREAPRLAVACHEMSERFLRGGRLLAFGRGPYTTDAQHVSVEFVHPVIVGKRALPALDPSVLFGPWLEALVRPDDMVMGFGPPEGDEEIRLALGRAAARGAMSFVLPGTEVSYAVGAASPNPFEHQELIEILYHTLWETVHVFCEHRELGHDVGQSGFLYPFLGRDKQAPADLEAQVASSILMKVADDAALRAKVAREEAERISGATLAIHDRLQRGGKLIIFGNGGSATDANDWAIDCVAPPPGLRPVPAVSLSMEPATVTAIANDVGPDVVFLRQLLGNLVCPASYDLGEDVRFVVLSVTEGEDKPLKYPTIFNTADVALITKIDMADAAGLDWDTALGNIQSVRPGMQTLGVSAKTGTGMAEYVALLEAGLLSARGAAVTGAP